MGKLNLDDVRQSAQDVKAAKGGGKFFKCQPGKNVVRLFTYDSAVLDGKTRLEHAIRRHYKLDGDNPLCEKTPAPNGRSSPTCRYCDRVEEIRGEEGDKVAKRLEANKKFVINVVPIVIGGNPVTDVRMQYFDAPTSVLETVLAVMDDSGNPDAFVGITGRDLAINYDPKADPKGMYTVMFRDETQSAKTSVVLKKSAADLLKAVADLDADAHLLPEWWKKEQGIKDTPKDGAKPAAAAKAAPAKKAVVAAPPSASPFEDTSDTDVPSESAAPADDDAPPDEAPAPDADEPPSDDTPAEPVDEPEAAAPEPDADPVYEGALPKGVTAWWSEGKGKFYFKLPNGKTTFDEAAALAAGGGPAKARPAAVAAPAKPLTVVKAPGKVAASKPAAVAPKATAKPVAKKGK